MSESWPLLDGTARAHLAGGALVGRRVRVDVATDDASGHVLALLAAGGAEVVADPGADLVVRPWTVTGGDVTVAVPVLDPTGDAHGAIRAVLRLTNRRLPGTRVAVVGFGPHERTLAGVVRALGGHVVVVDADPCHRLAALTDGLDIGAGDDAAIVFAAGADLPELAAGAVVAGPAPDALGAVLDESRPGVHRVRHGDREVFVLDPTALAGGRAPAWLDLMWTARLVTLAWVASTPDGGELPIGSQRELAAAALVARGVPA